MPIHLDDLLDPGRCALVLQEVQNGVVGDESTMPELADAARTVGVIEHVATLADAARLAGVPVIHCTAEHLQAGFGSNQNGRLFKAARDAGTLGQSGDHSVRPVPAVFSDEDLVLPRYHGLSPMTGTQLDSILRNEGRDCLVVAGVSINVAITNLVFDAVNRSYQVVVVTDAVAGFPVEYGEAMVKNSLRLVSTVATSAEVAAVWSLPPEGSDD